MDRLIVGKKCPLEVQRACGWFAEDYHRRQGRSRVPASIAAEAAVSLNPRPPKTPEGALGGSGSPA
jgi:hypothetical protein